MIGTTDFCSGATASSRGTDPLGSCPGADIARDIVWRCNVGQGDGAGVGDVATIALNFALDFVPKYPAVGDTPLADCHFATAAFVKAPK